MNDDATLLRLYATEGSQPAFTELVHRHVDLVYGAAMRRVGGDAHRATEVAQEVFTALARSAGKLSRHTILPAWLHTATRNAALNFMISEKRRLARETAALSLESATGAGSPVPEWGQVRPLLDSAIDELSETERAAVVLRFLEHRPFAEIAAVIRVSEDAARMRTDRALDKLRAALARRGITSTAAALGGLVSSQPLMSAPSGLASTLASHSLAAGGASLLAATLTSFMTTKLITTALLSAFLAFAGGAYVGFKHEKPVSSPAIPTVFPGQSDSIASLSADNKRLQEQVVGLRESISRLDSANAGLAANSAAPAPRSPAPKSPNIGLPVYELQKSVLNNLRQIESARAQYLLEHGRPAGSIRDLVGVGRYIKTVRTVGGEDYSALSMADDQPLTVTTPDGVSITYDPSGVTTTKPDVPPAILRVQELGTRVQSSAMKAVEAYRAAHSGNGPPNEEAILPFFSTPQEGADYVEFMEAKKAAGL